MDHDADMRLQEEMEGDFIGLAEQWHSRGYPAADVAVAMLGLAMARVEALNANLDTEEAIRRARVTVERP